MSRIWQTKDHRGHRVERQWIFGGVERESGKCFLIPVEFRDKETLLTIIKQWILPGTTIISDCWKVCQYNYLGYGYLFLYDITIYSFVV